MRKEKVDNRKAVSKVPKARSGAQQSWTCNELDSLEELNDLFVKGTEILWSSEINNPLEAVTNLVYLMGQVVEEKPGTEDLRTYIRRSLHLSRGRAQSLALPLL